MLEKNKNFSREETKQWHQKSTFTALELSKMLNKNVRIYLGDCINIWQGLSFVTFTVNTLATHSILSNDTCCDLKKEK